MHEDMGPQEKIRQGITKKPRDGLGFETGSQPNLSLPQITFILTYATIGDLTRSAQEAKVTVEEMAEWMHDDGFRNIFDNMLENKREGVKQIGAQLLPLMLLELTKVMVSGKDKEKLTAIKLHAQMQGLLITQTATVDKGTLEALREELMRPRPIIRTLPSPGGTA